MSQSTFAGFPATLILDPVTKQPTTFGAVTVSNLSLPLDAIGTLTADNPATDYTTLLGTPGLSTPLVSLQKSFLLGLGDPTLTPIPNTTLLGTPTTSATLIQLLKGIQLNTIPSGAAAATPDQYFNRLDNAVQSGVGTGTTTLQSALFQNYGTDLLWVMLFDTGTAVVDGATPNAGPYRLWGTNGVVLLDKLTLGEFGREFSTGLRYALSTTPQTLTLPTGAISVTVEARYS